MRFMPCCLISGTRRDAPNAMERNFSMCHSIRMICVVLALTLAVSAFGAELPNIVFIFADDLGIGDLACYGHPYSKTPSLDKLASEGTMFREFYVTGVTCCPSRTGFMTSKFPARFEKYMSDFGFGDSVTVTELLKQKGYRTGHFGKWHIGPVTENGTYGIDHIEVIGNAAPGPEGRDADLFEAAIRFIEENKEGPFYVNVWGHISHFPVDPSPELAAQFSDVKVDRADFSDWMQEKFGQCEELGGDVDACMRNYLGDVYSLDVQVGRLLARIDKLGLRENTLVVFSSDQGPAPVLLGNEKNATPERAPYARNMLGYAGGFRGGKHNQYEGGVRSPFIIRWPGSVPANHVNDTSVISGVDWLPTLCAIAGIDIDRRDLDGENVLDIWQGATRSREGTLFWKTNSDNSAPAMRDGNWKFHAFGRNAVELYDLENDPGERHNLAETRPEVVQQLTTKLEAWTKTLPGNYIHGSGGGGED
jgi:N-acetylgalactosamine-6-sulfatase